MIQAVGATVHQNLPPAQAYEMYQDLKNGK
jgi:hypothetical protein